MKLRVSELLVCALAIAVSWPAVAGGAKHPRVALTTALGEIVVELYPEKAPVTVANFLRYVDEKRYADSMFYRVVRPDNQPDKKVKIEVVQGGLGIEASDKELPPIAHETTKATGILHKDGTLSMARAEPGTASSEFFVCVGDQPELDFGGHRNPDGKGFAAFGKVVKGMDVVRKIQSLPDDDQFLKEPVKITSFVRQ